MTSSRPYLFRAIYEWLTDNRLTPYVVINAKHPHVQVPERFIEEGKIILNISAQAVTHLSMNKEILEFKASFSGVPQHIYAPMEAVMAIYAFENGRGMVFQDEPEEGGDGGGDDSGGQPPTTKSPDDQSSKAQAPVKGRPNLKIVK